MSDSEGAARPRRRRLRESGAPDLFMDLDSDSDDEAAAAEAPPGHEQADRALLEVGRRQPRALENLLRQVIWVQRRDEPEQGSYEELLQLLRRNHCLTSERVTRALRACPRNAFLPRPHDQPPDAFADVPVRIDAMDFNVSAPHMHATCLEALDLQPGHAFLDIGCGCGLVGKTGRAVGIDVKRPAVVLSRRNLAALAAADADYAASAAPTTFELHNAFTPSLKHQGRYDRVHSGASCRPSRLRTLVALLRPGGLLVTPVSPHDLQLIRRLPDGGHEARILSQVRYSDLELPGDAEVVRAQLRIERRARLAPPALPSSFAADVAEITGAPGTSGGSSASAQSGSALGGAPPTWPKRVARFLTACSGSLGSSSSGSGSERMSIDSARSEEPRGAGSVSGRGSSPRSASPALDARELGPPDCALTGAGWRIPVHRCVLRARCDLFRARCDSGMRDAGDAELRVPEHFSEEAVRVLARYLYEDALPRRAEPGLVAAALHVAEYFGVHRLGALCEAALAAEVLAADPEDADECETAVALLGLADEGALAHLRAAALDFAVRHFEAASATAAWGALPRRAADAVAREATGLLRHSLALLADLRSQTR